MQVALLVPEQEWRQLLADVQRLKEFEAAAPKTPPTPPDRLFTVREAAEYLRFTPEGIRKARRAGRLTGVRLNEKEWGFRLSELDRYVKRYHRQLPPMSPVPEGRPLMAKAA
ncbi:helix-turn-helix domain-containing protein [Hymenobacter sp. IS2118]|uniref:helix-turn-helix domain-containing protein n=1 Tax=Hymenobacter sp. IS2118 TaxID=1505605 RepID=UPI00055669AB|nr:helix-turn-helix domain-containing protein [Hymenobacter sp. IS2118]